MSKFTGVECLVCKKKFTDADDVVVCPECGTPYHRECYAEEGKCINEKLHEENKSWSQENSKSGKERLKICQRCNAENKPHALICENCGSSLVDNLDFENRAQQTGGFSGQEQNQNFGGGYAFNPYDKYLGMNPEEKLDSDVTVAEAADFVNTNTPYYLMIFKRMKDTGKKIAVSLVCAFFAEFYFAYRKMWAEAIVVNIIKTLLVIPSIISNFPYMSDMFERLGYSTEFFTAVRNVFDLESTSFILALTVASYTTLVLNLLCFLFGNWFYYRHMQKKVSMIKITYTSQEEINDGIARAGGTSFMGIILMAAVKFVIVIGILVGIKCMI